MTMVRATRKGYYGSLREPGERFALREEKHFSKRWMERIDGKAPAEAKPEKPVKAKPEKPTGDQEVI